MKYLLLFALSISFVCCKKKSFTSPKGYDIVHAEKHVLKNSLREISGIDFAPGSAEDKLYAVQDENGKIYTVSLADNAITNAKFGEPGDYEDLVFAKGKLFVLESQGVIVRLAYDIAANTFTEEARFPDLIPTADYEGLSVIGDTLLVLCKTCKGDVKAKNNLLIYKMPFTDSSVTLAGTISPEIDVIEGDKKEKIFPSGLAQNPLDNNWYVLSGKEHVLMLFDSNFKFMESHPLDPAEYRQPEGISFDSKGNLYISNEGAGGSSNIMVSKHQ